jgi:hypothetical protein
VRVDLTDLYQGPLEEFVERRTRLARDLRTTDPAAASAIGKLRKPPVSVWAIDQLAIDHQDLLVELLAAGADARDAHRAVAGQGATRESLLLASGRLRDAVDAAARAADDALARAGHARGDETGRRIRTTLQSAVTGSAADRAAVWQGTLDHDVEATGFGAVDGPGDDEPQLANLVAALRRPPATTNSSPPVVRAPSDDTHSHREAQERVVEKLDAAFARARDLARAKRRHADALAEEATVAEGDAANAEAAAEKAAEAARAARSRLES